MSQYVPQRGDAVWLDGTTVALVPDERAARVPQLLPALADAGIVVPEFVLPVLDRRKAVALVVVDCMRLDQWMVIEPLLEGVQHLIQLARIELECNEIDDISRLASLTWLEELNLDRNEISDLAPLAAMSNLRVLGLYENRVSDLTPLRGLESLEIAYLSGNRISDVSPLAGLDQLRHLWLYLNCQDVEYDADGDVVSRADCLADISTLDGMSQLESLIFHMNDVADISAISRESMPALEVVFATGNLITDVSTLAGLPVLRSAFIDSNFIDSIEPFVLNTDFPAGAPWTFERGTVSMPPAGWAPTTPGPWYRPPTVPPMPPGWRRAW